MGIVRGEVPRGGYYSSVLRPLPRMPLRRTGFVHHPHVTPLRGARHLWLRRLLLALVLVSWGGCQGIQSTLAPAGRGAEQIATLFWWLLAGALIVWVLVVGITILAIHVQAHGEDARRARYLIIGGGTALPTVVLAVYLSFGLNLLPELTRPAPEGSLTIVVTGEQWWWRVRYPDPTGETPGIELANEIRLPVGRPVQLYLDTRDVIHSFWIPSLGGKMDMVPGRVNRLALHPTKTGTFRGACAEYCGDSHAFMSMYAVVMEADRFDEWLAIEAGPAAAPRVSELQRGAELFIQNGCGACHAIRGTDAAGRVGPDLTHIGSRVSVGAGTFLTDHDALVRWISHTERVKPGVFMPSFGMLPEEDIDAMAAYLLSLK